MQKSQQRSWFSFFFWPIKAREFYVSNFCTVQNWTDLFSHLTKILSLVCYSASDDSPVEDDEHDGDHVAADLLHHQVDLVTLPLLLLTTGAALLLEGWSKLFTSQLSNHKQTQNGCPSFYFAIFTILGKNLIHIMQVILIGWLNEVVSFWRRKRRTMEHLWRYHSIFKKSSSKMFGMEVFNQSLVKPI